MAPRPQSLARALRLPEQDTYGAWASAPARRCRLALPDGPVFKFKFLRHGCLSGQKAQPVSRSGRRVFPAAQANLNLAMKLTCVSFACEIAKMALARCSHPALTARFELS